MPHPQRRPRDLRLPARQAARHDPRPGRPRHPGSNPATCISSTSSHPLTGDGRQVLESLFALRATGPATTPAGQLVLVVPRFGTVSPVVEQGHRHRARLRAHGGAAVSEARRSDISCQAGPAAVAGGMVGDWRRAARPLTRAAARGPARLRRCSHSSAATLVTVRATEGNAALGVPRDAGALRLSDDESPISNPRREPGPRPADVELMISRRRTPSTAGTRSSTPTGCGR